MTETENVYGYTLVYDAAATVAAYARVPTPGPEQCTCWPCRNWVAGRGRLVPPEVRSLLRRFGVPLNGEIEVWEVSGEPATPHWYGGWYTVVGEVQSVPEAPGYEFALASWRLSFSKGRSYAVPAFASLDVFEVHFFVETVAFIDPDS